PKLGVGLLKDMSVYVSAGNGTPGNPGENSPAGIGLEVMSRLTTQTFLKEAKKKGVKVTARFRNSGIHNWPYWQFEMTQAWPQIANALSLSEDDRGAQCAAGGAI